MTNEARMLAEFIRKQAGVQFKPPFYVQAPEDLSRADRWIIKHLLRQGPHWIVLNIRGTNPFGTNGWFNSKEDANMFANVMNELGVNNGR